MALQEFAADVACLRAHAEYFLLSLRLPAGPTPRSAPAQRSQGSNLQYMIMACPASAKRLLAGFEDCPRLPCVLPRA